MPKQAESPTVKDLRALFDTAASGYDYELRTTKQTAKIIDALPDQECVEMIEKGIGRSRKRWFGAASMVLHFRQREPIDSWIVSQLSSPELGYFPFMLQQISLERATRFAAVLNKLIEERSDCQEQTQDLIRVARDLGAYR